MRLTTLMLAAMLALGTGLSGNALAGHDHGARGYGHGYGYGHDRYRHGRPGLKRGHRHWHRGHRVHRDYRPRYRSRRYDDDSWYGIHLFFGGH